MTQYYVGTKLITAWPEEASKDIGDNKAGDPGYGVKYDNGYTSWSPKNVFESAYMPIGPDEPADFVSEELAEDFILQYMAIPVGDTAIAVEAALANGLKLVQVVSKTQLADSDEEGWKSDAEELAVDLIGLEVTKHLAFLIACAKNGIQLVQAQEATEPESAEEE